MLTRLMHCDDEDGRRVAPIIDTITRGCDPFLGRAKEPGRSLSTTARENVKPAQRVGTVGTGPSWARALAGRLSPSPGQGSPALPSLRRRPARRGGRNPTDAAENGVSLQVAMTRRLSPGFRPAATSRPRHARALPLRTANPAGLPSPASPFAPCATRPCRRHQPPSLRPPSRQTHRLRGGRLAYNPHSRGDPRFSPAGLST